MKKTLKFLLVALLGFSVIMFAACTPSAGSGSDSGAGAGSGAGNGAGSGSDSGAGAGTESGSGAGQADDLTVVSINDLVFSAGTYETVVMTRSQMTQAGISITVINEQKGKTIIVGIQNNSKVKCSFESVVIKYVFPNAEIYNNMKESFASSSDSQTVTYDDANYTIIVTKKISEDPNYTDEETTYKIFIDGLKAEFGEDCTIKQNSSKTKTVITGSYTYNGTDYEWTSTYTKK